jgi:hypothetical protein
MREYCSKINRKGAKNAKKAKKEKESKRIVFFNLYFLTQMTQKRRIFADSASVLPGLQKISVADATKILGHL